jgi:Tol biopolymer transport system component/DNA-binding winged helix-turn-helix (wHTH) protein
MPQAIQLADAIRIVPNPVIRFGAFEANRKTGELRKGGTRIKLADQPFRLLVALLDRPGELVSRDELRHVLWLDRPAGNLEQGLNRTVNKLRAALSDSAASPRFVETLPGYGYRFIGTVEQEPPVQPAPKPKNRWMTALIAAALAAGLFGYLIWKRLPGPVPELRWRKLTTDNFNKTPPALSDGTRIYFIAGYAGESFLAQIPASGGQPAKLPITLPGPVCSLQDLSPNGQEILLTAGVMMDRSRTLPLWTLQIADGTARRLATLPATSAAYSPTGAIAFTTESELWLLPHGNPPRRLLERKDSLLGTVSWTPDGRTIRFSAQNPLSAQSSAWEVEPDGTHLRPVMPKWQGMSYISVGRDAQTHLELFAADGSFWAASPGWPPFRAADDVPTRVTGSEPEFSDRVRLRSTSFPAIGVDRLGELQRFDARTNDWKPLLDGLSAEQAEFSRDGKRVAYVTYPQQTLWVRDADGKRPIQLTSPPVIARYPHWSPDGRRLVFTAQQAPDRLMRIYIVDADGGGMHLATTSEQGSQGDASWSADGRRLVYGLDVRSARENAYIRIVDLGSGQVTKLAGSEGLFGPRWSPDGSRIAALERDGRRRMMIYRMDTGQWSVLFDDRADWPVWTKDGAAILFKAGDSLEEIDLRTRQQKKIVTIKNEGGGGFTHAIGIDSSDAPTRTLNRDGRQVYELHFPQR